jgi:pimeloyl-ACP methyl ester carboxylesterase
MEVIVGLKSILPIILVLSTVFSLRTGAADIKQIDVNGTAFNYVEQGQGVPVVLVHGSLGDYRTWTGEMGDFAARYHVIAYSLRNHYPDTWTGGPYSSQGHIADLVALLQALNLGPVHLVGHSYGGTMAAVVARDHPELVRSLVLAEPGLNSLVANVDEAKPLLTEFFKVAKAAQEHTQKGELDEAVITFMDFINEGGGGFKGLPVAFQAGMLQNSTTLKASFASPPPPTFTCDDASKIGTPTLVVEGELTLKVRRLIDNELVRCIPRVERVLILRTAHPLEMLNPKDFNATVLEFLAKH